MQTHNRPAFLFDLDGTLLDSKGDLADAANAARQTLGLPPLTDAAVEVHTGRGMAALLAGVLPEMGPESLAAARAAFIAHYREHLVVRSRPFASVAPMFEALAGHPMGIVTNKPSMFTLPILEKLDWRRHFQAVVCGDTCDARKPSPEPLLHALRLLGIMPEECVFVGDTSIDQETAAAAGVRFVCVSWGRAAIHSPRCVTDLAQLRGLFPTA